LSTGLLHPSAVRSARSLAKCEVHVHLEGCFEIADLVQLAKAAGEPLPRPPHRLFDFADFDSFLSFLDWEGGLVRTPEQLARVAYRFSARESASGARYADPIVNITHWEPWRDKLGAFLDALDAGFTEAEQDGFASAGLCISLLRQMTEPEALEVVDELVRLRHPRVVALSIDGNEARAGRSGPRFAEAFRRAKAAGLRSTVHAGESSGAEGVRDAIEFLGADRIDHGVRAIEDPDLVRMLVDQRIPLDLCPGTNITIGLYPDRASHPLDELRKAGVVVSVNTDDPSYETTSLAAEYAVTAAVYGWDENTMKEVASNSVVASFANDDLKRRILDEINRWNGEAAT
jgi:adenosine deaminase